LQSETKTVSGKMMSSLLEKKGWTLARITGSHDLKTGLQRAIMKQARTAEDEL
jgi:predicted RNA binding protein YcfA (HicA-like mRNA interferase family)